MLFGCVGALYISLAGAQDWEDDFKASSARGKRAFTSNCAGCHGLDGKGSEKAPNIAGNAKVQHLTDAQLSDIVSNGVPGTGMPAFHSLSPPQVQAMVNYLRLLQGQFEAQVLPGDPSRGKKIFFGKGECSTCHAVSGEGGFIGPDLSGYAASMPSKAVLDAIVKTNRMARPGYKLAAATTREGARVEGVVRNEDNFSVQLQTTDGSFHFLQKSDLQKFEYLDQSLMPTNYSERLTRDELNDLASYLMKAGSPSATPAHTGH